MITVLALLFGAVLLVGIGVLVMTSVKGKRDGKSSQAVATQQQQMSNPRGDVRSGTGLD